MNEKQLIDAIIRRILDMDASQIARMKNCTISRMTFHWHFRPHRTSYTPCRVDTGFCLRLIRVLGRLGGSTP